MLLQYLPDMLQIILGEQILGESSWDYQKEDYMMLILEWKEFIKSKLATTVTFNIKTHGVQCYNLEWKHCRRIWVNLWRVMFIAWGVDPRNDKCNVPEVSYEYVIIWEYTVKFRN